MTKNQKRVHVSDEYVVASSGGFPPNWTPEEDGESFDFIPIGIRAMKGAKKGKGKMKQGYVLDVQYVAAKSESFTQGSGKNSTQIEVSAGTVVSVNLNATLMGESEDDRRLAFVPMGAKGKDRTNLPQLTNLSNASKETGKALRVIFHGSVPLGGGRSVKRFEIHAPASLLNA